MSLAYFISQSNQTGQIPDIENTATSSLENLKKKSIFGQISPQITILGQNLTISNNSHFHQRGKKKICDPCWCCV